MLWTLIVITLQTGPWTPQATTQSIHPTMIECFEARDRYIKTHRDLTPPQVTCLRVIDTKPS